MKVRSQSLDRKVMNTDWKNFTQRYWEKNLVHSGDFHRHKYSPILRKTKGKIS